MDINQKFELKSFVTVDNKLTEKSVKFDFRFLSNKLRAKIIDIDAKYNKLFNAEKRANEKSKKNLKNDDSDMLQEATDILDVEFAKATWDMNDAKTVETLQTIAKPESDVILYSDFSSEFWQNADMGTAKEIIEFFRQYYKLG